MNQPFDYDRLLAPFNAMAREHESLQGEHEEVARRVQSLYRCVEDVLSDGGLVARIELFLQDVVEGDEHLTSHLLQAIANQKLRRNEP